METTYIQLKSLILSEIWEGNQVKLKFRAANQDQAIETMGMAMPSQEEIMKKVMAEMAKSTASSMAINSAAKGLDGILGTGGLAGTVASQSGLGYQMNTNNIMNIELTEEVKQQTILNAFAGLQMYYELKDNTWVYKQPAI